MSDPRPVTAEQVILALVKRPGLLRNVVIEAIEGGHVTTILPWEDDLGPSGEEEAYRWRHWGDKNAPADADYVAKVWYATDQRWHLKVLQEDNTLGTHPRVFESRRSAQNRGDALLRTRFPEWVML